MLLGTHDLSDGTAAGLIELQVPKYSKDRVRTFNDNDRYVSHECKAPVKPELVPEPRPMLTIRFRSSSYPVSMSAASSTSFREWGQNGLATTTLSNWPTMLNAATNAGMILGTTAYRNPEQSYGNTQNCGAGIRSGQKMKRPTCISSGHFSYKR
jgi:hypothetical protein